MAQTRTVTVTTAHQGTHSTHGVVRDARTGRKIWTGPERPYGFTDAARQDAEAQVARRGWVAEAAE